MTGRMLLALAALPLLLSCDSRRLTVCEDAIKGKLRSPSTFERIAAHPQPKIDDNDRFRIEFDAANAFGVPIRHKWDCTIGPRGDVEVGPGLEDMTRDLNDLLQR